MQTNGSPGAEFALHDCCLVRSAEGRNCINLRELLEAMRNVSPQVIEHHMLRCALEDHFELYEFPNDLARWCWDALAERQLAEELALVNPFLLADMEAVRSTVVSTIEDRLWSLDRVPWCRPGLELYLVQSQLISFDTGERFQSLAGLAEALPRMSRRSIFFHVHEAHRRHGVDDFSAWLERIGADGELVAKLRTIDFYFLNLNQLRRQLLETICEFLSEPAAVLGART